MRSLRARLRRRAGAFVVDNLFRGLSVAGRLHPLAKPERHGIEVIRDVPYRDGGGADHVLDVWRPKDRTGPRPAVLYIHGGGFRILSKDSHWVMGLAFAREGYVVFNMSYRLAPRHPYPAAIEDVADAYRFVIANAAKYGADPQRIVVAGESAGANLATVLTLMTCYEREEPFARDVFETGITPRATLAFCGMLQVSDPERFRRRDPKLSMFTHDRVYEVHEAYLGPSQVPRDRCDLADPLCVLERGAAPSRPLPPFFVPCGGADPVLDDSVRLKTALDRLGVACQAPIYAGEHHAFMAIVLIPNARRCWRDCYRFLETHA